MMKTGEIFSDTYIMKNDMRVFFFENLDFVFILPHFSLQMKATNIMILTHLYMLMRINNCTSQAREFT